jgi:hypothetical protein
VQQWARDAEAALDHELQAMHSSVSEAISSDAAALLYPYSDVPGFMATMSLAISKLASLEAFVRQVSKAWVCRVCVSHETIRVTIVAAYMGYIAGGRA